MAREDSYAHAYNRPLYYGKDSRLVDIVREELYYNSGLNNLVNLVDSKLYKGVKDISGLFTSKKKTNSDATIEDITTNADISNTTDINSNPNKNNKEAILALTLGLGLSAISNYVVTSLIADKGIDYDIIDWGSFFGELVPHTLISTAVYLATSWKKGRTFNETWKELAYIITPITATLSFIPYRLSRNVISNTLMDWDVLPPEATLIAQAVLFLPYLLAVKYSLKAVKSTQTVKLRLEKWHQEGIDIKNNNSNGVTA